MSRILKKDIVREQTFHEDGDRIVIATEQDVTEIIEQNKKEYNATPSRWGDDIFDNKIASIPLTVIDDLNKQGIMRGFYILDKKAFRKFLNDPDNRVFRTRQGKI
jgi:hypothetical protein